MAAENLEAVDALARAAKTGEFKDISVLIRAIEPTVVATVRRVVAPSDVADVTQNALVRIVTGLESWNPERGSFRTWSAVVARHAAIDSVRRSRRRPELLQAEVVDVEPDTAPYLAQIDDAALIWSVHETLRTRRDVPGRRVLAAARDLAHRGDDLTVAAIAREAELDESTTRRALMRLRVLLRELEVK